MEVVKSNMENTAKEGFNVQQYLNDCRRQASVATNAGGRAVDAFKEAIGRVIKKFMGFAMQAVEIAVSKFLIELCAMIISAVAAALTSKHGRVDITTPGVFHTATGAAAPQAAPQAPSWNSNPFDSWNSNNRAQPASSMGINW